MIQETKLNRDEKRKLHEAKELERLKKEKNKPQFVGYLFFFIFVITMVYMVDEIATNIGKFLEMDVLGKIFGSIEKANVSSERALVTTLIAVISGCAMFLRPLADRFGRKIFLVIYTFGMGVAMLIIAITSTIPGWVVGTLLIQMCIPHDMQQVYIEECVPAKKRATYYTVIKAIATLGMLMIPFFNVKRIEDAKGKPIFECVQLGKISSTDEVLFDKYTPVPEIAKVKVNSLKQKKSKETEYMFNDRKIIDC